MSSAKDVYHKELTVSECCLISPSAAAFKILILLGSSCKARSYMSCAYKSESANVNILQITIEGLRRAWNLLLLCRLPCYELNFVPQVRYNQVASKHSQFFKPVLNSSGWLLSIESRGVAFYLRWESLQRTECMYCMSHSAGLLWVYKIFASPSGYCQHGSQAWQALVSSGCGGSQSVVLL